jgi:hypothetical protein
VSAEVAKQFTYVPFETFDLEANLPENFFTVGTVVEYKAPETSKNGKTFSTFKFSNLVKYDMSKINKHILNNEKLTAELPNFHKQASRSFNLDGYKTLRVMVFKDELCKKIGEKIGVVGLVVCLSNLSRLDYSEHSGVSFRIESEGQVACIGKAEDLSFCKGAPKGASANLLPVMQLGNHL